LKRQAQQLRNAFCLEFHKGNYTVSTDKGRLDIAVIHDFLANHSYWSPGISLPVVQRGIENSLCFGLYEQNEQVGFARVITDYTALAYLLDVFILEPYRGQGLGKWLIECIVSHPELRGVRRWMLATRDAHGLYARYGFQPLGQPEVYMAAANPGSSSGEPQPYEEPAQ
jgi:GNAT superfamily N-acetyltransferase